jgi:hypothetical protein
VSGAIRIKALSLNLLSGGRYDKLDRNSGSQMQFSGPISVTLNPPTMSLNIQNYSPKEWCGPLGCTPIRMLAVETYRFRVSQNELLLIGPKGGRWQYKRIQQGSR